MKTKKIKKSQELKIVISRTYSEGAKINIGNYQSRDFFASATRMQEVQQPATLEYLEQLSAQLFQLVKMDVKSALQAEVENASDNKPPEKATFNEKFNPDGKRNVPWAKFQPREYNEEEDTDAELK